MDICAALNFSDDKEKRRFLLWREAADSIDGEVILEQET